MTKFGERSQFSEIKGRSALQLFNAQRNFWEEVSPSFSAKKSYHVVTPLIWTNLRFFIRLNIKIKLTLL